MRISSRGSVSMGPVGWLICLPFLAIVGGIYVAGWLLVLILKGVYLLTVALIARHEAKAPGAPPRKRPSYDAAFVDNARTLLTASPAQRASGRAACPAPDIYGWRWTDDNFLVRTESPTYVQTPAIPAAETLAPEVTPAQHKTWQHLTDEERAQAWAEFYAQTPAISDGADVSDSS